MPPLSQSYSFSSYGGSLSLSQYAQNTSSNIAEGLRRVTIKQLLKATVTENACSIDGFTIKKFILVANIYYEEFKVSNKSYGLDDGTGRIMGFQWCESGASGLIFNNFAYARVVAELNMYKNTKSLNILQIFPVSNAYEAYYHILHVIHDSVALERGPPPQHILHALQDKTNDLNGEFSQISAPVIASPEPHNDPSDDPSGFTALERDVIKCITEVGDSNQMGAHVSVFIPRLMVLDPTLTSRELWHALEELVRRGHLQVTDNEQHYYRCI